MAGSADSAGHNDHASTKIDKITNIKKQDHEKYTKSR
jgi:hypothetical protein